MIAVRIKRDTADNYGRLAQYIANAEDPGEKLDQFWIVNSNAGESLDDLDLAIVDILNTQNKSARSQDKTYHLMVSFRDEKPSPEALKDMESHFAKALGYENHQRVCSTHENTENYHMHIAYNRVDPQTARLKMPSWDYVKLSQVCREMEQKYNLKVDNGFEKTKEPDYERPNQGAKDFEAQTWQQSFDSYVKEQKKELLNCLGESHDWQELHEGFGERGLLLKKRGNGAVIASTDGKHAIKSSSLDRKFSKGQLERRFGKWQDPEKEKEAKQEYIAKPLTKHPAQKELWDQFCQGKKEQKQRRKKAKKKSGTLGKLYRSWKDFLMLQALNDPLAMAVITLQRKQLQMLGLGR